MNLEINNISCERAEYIDSLLQLWEVSVRASHHFLSDFFLIELIPFVRESLERIPQLIAAKSNNVIVGFMGIETDKLESLFILPEYFGKGIGRKMLNFALHEYRVKYINVNEQNSAALHFYTHCGFAVYNRSELDGQGNPFPILHLTRKVVETERLYLREITQTDFSTLCPILQDDNVMYAWGHAFTDEEVRQWITRNMNLYQTNGYGYWLAFDKNSNECIGQIGLIAQEFFGVTQIGIGWILAKKYWKKGYAVEGATACMNYAFNTLHTPRVIANIRPTNITSIHVAERIGMNVQGQYNKVYHNEIIPHLLYVARTPQVKVTTYHSVWQEQFCLLKKHLTPILKRFGGILEHVGSTSVPGLTAKPVIDADYILADSALWVQLKEELEQFGFYHRGDGGLTGREMFTESLYLPFRHNFYVCMPDSIHLANHIKLRNFLRKHPDEARRYGELKIRLAQEFPNDIDSYCAGKSDLLSEFLESIGFDNAEVNDIHALNQSPPKL